MCRDEIQDRYTVRGGGGGGGGWGGGGGVGGGVGGPPPGKFVYFKCSRSKSTALFTIL